MLRELGELLFFQELGKRPGLLFAGAIWSVARAAAGVVIVGGGS